MSTLVVDLDGRIAKSPRFKKGSIAEYFRKSDLRWWRAISQKGSYREQNKIITTWLSKCCAKKVLELGPGFGRITSLIRTSHPDELTLIEVNELALQFLNKKFPNAHLISADVSRHDLGAESYDLIVVVEVFVHIPDIETLLRKIHSALKDCGSAIVSITPLSWYKENTKGQATIHRGIERSEFEEFVEPLFAIQAIHQSTTGQHLSYLLQKR